MRAQPARVFTRSSARFVSIEYRRMRSTRPTPGRLRIASAPAGVASTNTAFTRSWSPPITLPPSRTICAESAFCELASFDRHPAASLLAIFTRPGWATATGSSVSTTAYRA